MNKFKISIIIYLTLLLDVTKINFDTKTKNFFLLHFFKIDIVPLFVTRIFFFFIDFCSLIRYFKFFSNLSDVKQKIIYEFTNKYLSSISSRINELFFALYIIQSDFNHNIKQNKLESKEHKNFYDFIVIGSGPSGAITAHSLKKKGYDVLILEAGKFFEISKSKHPGYEFIKKWSNGGIQTTIFSSMVNYSSGNCFGGGSEINSGLYHFPDEKFIKKMRDKNELDNFDTKIFNKLNKSIMKICNITSNDLSQKISSCKNFILGCKKNDYKIELIPRLYKFENNKLIKNSMTNTFLKEYLDMNGDVSLNTKVDSFSKDKKKWTLKTNKGEFSCNKLFLCCGALKTQELIKNSNNDTKIKLGNFKFHIMTKMIPKFPNSIQDQDNDVHSYQLTNFYPKYISGESTCAKRFIFASLFNDKEAFEDAKLNWQNMSIYHNTFSVGKGNVIKIPFFNNFINSYKISKKNINLFKEASANLAKILFDGGAEYIYLLNKKIIKINKKNYLSIINDIKNVNEFKLSAVHLLGGISFGKNTKFPLDQYGKVKNFEGLYINDSSLINENLLQNPQGTIMVIAYRNIMENISRNFN